MIAQPQQLSSAELLLINPLTVDPDEAGRIGLFYPAKADALGVMMARDGQNDPIKVISHKLSSKYEWKLVSGLHRLRGCISAGLQVHALLISASDDLNAIQASENMHRRELEPLERAMFVRTVADVSKARVLAEHGAENEQQLGGLKRQNKVQFSEIEKADEVAAAAGVNLTRAYGWREETAEALGLDLNALKRAMRIHRLIIEPFPELIGAFKDHPVAKVADSLLKIAAIKDVAQRRKVIEVLLAGPKDLAFAIQSVGLTPPAALQSKYDKFSSQILGGWSRLGTGDKRRFIPDLVSAIPVGMRALVREELDRLDGEGPSAVEHYTQLAAEAAEEAK